MHSTRKGERPWGEAIVITPGEDPRRFRAELEAELEATKRELETTKRDLERARAESARPDALLEQDSIVDYWTAVSQLAKARDDIRKLKEDNHANAQPG